MSVLGTVFLWVALLAAAASVAAFAAAGIKGKDAGVAAQAARAARIGRMLVGVSAAALLVCCLILAGCFLTGDVSLLYVLQERSNSTSSLAWFYKLSGLWAGRAGSLLFWAFLISLFSAVVSLRTRRDGDRLALLGGGKRKLSDILIDKKVPRALRDSVPLIVMGEEILWAVGAAPGKTCAVMPESVQALVIEYQPLKEKNDAVFKG